MLPPLLLLDGSWPEEPGLDTAVSQILLDRVSSGAQPPTLRLYVPGREVAFGKRDTVTPQYPDAVAAARAAGFASVQRLAGGRAAVFTEDTIAFSLALPDPDPRVTIYTRFDHITQMIVTTFARLGIASAVGELPGEYCPGQYSVHHEHRIKLMGVGQRLAKRGAHIGGVITVNRPEVIRRALVPVYQALQLDWDPDTVGTLGDVQTGITNGQVISALELVFASFYSLFHDQISPEVVGAAREIKHRYLPGL